jgi:phospholipase/carboxylesterase
MTNAARMRISSAQLGSQNSLRPSLSDLNFEGGRNATIFFPPNCRDAVGMPLLCMLHGAVGVYPDTLPALFELAKRESLVIIAPLSLRRTWGVLYGGYGEDVRFIELLINLMLRQHGIDSSCLTLAGFSDGASYALTVGLKNGDVFPDIIAFSPGFFLPDSPVGKPQVFISHGSADRMLPVTSARGIADRLKGDGYHLKFEEFEGAHEVPGVIIEAAVCRFLRRKVWGKS